MIIDDILYIDEIEHNRVKYAVHLCFTPAHTSSAAHVSMERVVYFLTEEHDCDVKNQRKLLAIYVSYTQEEEHSKALEHFKKLLKVNV
jgi:hypothetical protein